MIDFLIFLISHNFAWIDLHSETYRNNFAWIDSHTANLSKQLYLDRFALWNLSKQLYLDHFAHCRPIQTTSLGSLYTLQTYPNNFTWIDSHTANLSKQLHLNLKNLWKLMKISTLVFFEQNKFTRIDLQDLYDLHHSKQLHLSLNW